MIAPLRTLISRLIPGIMLYLLLNFVLRVVLAATPADGAAAAIGHAQVAVWQWPAALVVGLWFDLIVLPCLLLPAILWWLCLPARAHGGPVDRWAGRIGRFLFAFALLFGMVAQFLFWREFDSRFNFIAVDYLIYTTEVLRNIWQSYPVVPLLAGVAVLAAGISLLMGRIRPATAIVTHAIAWPKRLLSTVVVGGLTAVALWLTPGALADVSADDRVNELAANGEWRLIEAYVENELDYRRFYATRTDADVDARLRRLLAAPNATFTGTAPDDMTRQIAPVVPPRRLNVMIITMESMGAEFVDAFNGPDGFTPRPKAFLMPGLTPNLDRFAREGVAFANAYATGTRTVRGLEAITLAAPPTPGQSILRRPDNGGLNTLPGVLQDAGYNARFIYGGYGYFDNMNEFYAANGISKIDRAELKESFGNAWGVCDEDLFNGAIADADAAFAAGKPFVQIVMTTSNHRPYTFPTGRITETDKIRQGTREGAIAYSDYAMGQLIENAKTKPWFKDTIFVFVADHTANAAGRVTLEPERYHIPMVFYAPELLKPQLITRRVSQADLAPTLLGLLGQAYKSRFYGQDVLNFPTLDPLVYISNYQFVGLMRGDDVAVLEPRRLIRLRRADRDITPDPAGQNLIDDTIALYSHAADWRRHLSKETAK